MEVLRVFRAFVARVEQDAVLRRSYCSGAYRNAPAVLQVRQRLRVECARAYRQLIVARSDCEVCVSFRRRDYRRHVERYVARYVERLRLVVVRENVARVAGHKANAVRARERIRIRLRVARTLRQAHRVHVARRQRQIAREPNAVHARIVGRYSQRVSCLQAVVLEERQVIERYHAVLYAYRRTYQRFGNRSRQRIIFERYRIRAQACQREVVLFRVICEQRVVRALEARNARSYSVVVRRRTKRCSAHCAFCRSQTLAQ